MNHQHPFFLFALCQGMAVCMLLSLAERSAAQQPQRAAGPQAVKPEQVWLGRNEDEKLRELVPKKHALTTASAFENVWKAWCTGEVPKIDFEKSFVYVATVSGPNSIFLQANNEVGNLTTKVGSTRAAGPGFGYLLAKFSRQGIVQVDGVPLNQAGANDSDFVRVDIAGTLTTGIAAIGGETTGTTITAGNITWEVELNKFRRPAQAWSGKRVRISGTLQRRGGVEIAERWIVHVEQIRPEGEIIPRPRPRPIAPLPQQKSVPQKEQSAEPSGAAEDPLVKDQRGGELHVRQADAVLTIKITSPAGIGSGIIVRPGKQWPAKVVVQAYLKGLESFRVSCADGPWQLAVPSGDDGNLLVTLGNNEKRIKPNEPWYPKVTKVGKVRDQQYHMLIELPRRMFEDEPQQLEIRWIDFYRD